MTMTTDTPTAGNWSKDDVSDTHFNWDDNHEIVWAEGELSVNDNNKVKGQLISAPIEGPNTDVNDGMSVQLYVNSYEYDDGEKMNHVPVVHVVAPDGHIITTAESHDSQSPHTAINNAKSDAAYYFQNPNSTAITTNDN
jgi:hypothetical protein